MDRVLETAGQQRQQADMTGHRGTRAVQRMVEFAPATGSLALWAAHQDIADRSDERVIFTDGRTLFYGLTFEMLPLAEQTGLVAHTVLHIALRHAQRYLQLREVRGDVDLALFTVCADAIVNSTLAHLTWLKLPASAVFLEKLIAVSLGLNQSVEQALNEWDVERLYLAIDDRKKTGGAVNSGASDPASDAAEPTARATANAAGSPDGPRAASIRQFGAGILQDLQPHPSAKGPPEAEADEVLKWSERIVRGHASDGAFSMLRSLVADIPKSRTPWELLLRRLLARGLSRKPQLSWSRPSRSYIANHGRAGPNRRLPWEPGMSTMQTAPRLVVVIDVSGSIDDDLMQRFAREIEAIVRRQEAALVLVVGDDQVRHVTEVQSGSLDLAGIVFSGGGGTDFTPLLEEAGKHQPDIAIVLTDLDGPARFRPRWPVIWAVPEAVPSPPPPFGRKIALR